MNIAVNSYFMREKIILRKPFETVVFEAFRVYGPYSMARPLQNIDVLAVLDFQIPAFRPKSPALYPESWLADRQRHGKKTRTSATTGRRASKIQDGEDVEVLRSPVYAITLYGYFPVKIATEIKSRSTERSRSDRTSNSLKYRIEREPKVSKWAKIWFNLSFLKLYFIIVFRIFSR